MTRIALSLSVYIAALCVMLVFGVLVFGKLKSSNGQLVYYSTAGDGTLQAFDITLHITATIATRVTRGSFFPSPDGQQILFFRPETEAAHPYIVNVDGSNLRRVEVAPLTYRITWMPDSAHIFFADSTSQSFILLDVNDFSQQSLFPINEPLCQRFDVSPDGRFITLQTMFEYMCSVSLIQMDGNHIRTFIADLSGFFSIWSPDSRRLALYNNFVLYIVPDVTQDTVFEVRNIHLRSPISALAWSHDSTQIVFSADNAIDIFVVDVEPQIGYARNLTSTTSEEDYPVWLPSGNEIAFVSNRDHHEIYVMNDDGSNVRRLTFNDAVEGLLVWLP
jgi:Tol biopolymer transport system component